MYSTFTHPLPIFGSRGAPSSIAAAHLPEPRTPTSPAPYIWLQVNLFVYGEQLRICLSDVATQASARAASTAAAAEGAKQLPVVSPMPGKIVQVFVSAGDQVGARRDPSRTRIVHPSAAAAPRSGSTAPPLCSESQATESIPSRQHQRAACGWGMVGQERRGGKAISAAPT
eukprot:scaffold1027_cov116-Isochrysis_galbana.AAC.3